jgi:uncharacterized protein (TIGR03435 family)
MPRFDLILEYAPDSALVSRVMPQARSLDVTGPSMFTAIQEQLGLKLESSKGSVEVFVIDSVSKPSEN